MKRSADTSIGWRECIASNFTSHNIGESMFLLIVLIIL